MRSRSAELIDVDVDDSPTRPARWLLRRVNRHQSSVVDDAGWTAGQPCGQSGQGAERYVPDRGEILRRTAETKCRREVLLRVDQSGMGFATGAAGKEAGTLPEVNS